MWPKEAAIVLVLSYHKQIDKLSHVFYYDKRCVCYVLQIGPSHKLSSLHSAVHDSAGNMTSRTSHRLFVNISSLHFFIITIWVMFTRIDAESPDEVSTPTNCGLMTSL